MKCSLSLNYFIILSNYLLSNSVFFKDSKSFFKWYNQVANTGKENFASEKLIVDYASETIRYCDFSYRNIWGAFKKASDLYFYSPKLMSHEQNPLVGRWCYPSHAYMKTFAAVSNISPWLLRLEYRYVVHAHQVFIFTQADQTHWADISHQVLPKVWWYSISNHPEDSAMVPWAKLRSRSGATASNMAEPQWRVRHAQTGHPQVETGIRLRRFGKYSWKTVM